MKYIEIRKRLNSMGMTCFTTLDFHRATRATSRVAAQKLLERYAKNGLFARVRNGLYVLSENQPSLWALANKIYQPSYISMETALSYYGIIPETTYIITSVTSKITRNFTFGNNGFLYRKIKINAFTGYRPVETGKETALVAEKEKALADYLYFVFFKCVGMSERIGWDKIMKEKLLSYIKIFDNEKFERWARNAIGK